MIAALGSPAAALSITVVWPQVWLSCRHGRTLGLSPTGSWLAVGLNLCWLTFGLLVGDTPQIATHAVVGAGNTAVVAALLLTQPHARSAQVLLRTAAGAAGLAAGGVAAVVLGADTTQVASVLASVATVVGIVAALPQLLGILFDRAQHLSGMSPARWYLGAGSCASRTAYGRLLGRRRSGCRPASAWSAPSPPAPSCAPGGRRLPSLRSSRCARQQPRAGCWRPRPEPRRSWRGVGCAPRRPPRRPGVRCRSARTSSSTSTRPRSGGPATGGTVPG